MRHGTYPNNKKNQVALYITPGSSIRRPGLKWLSHKIRNGVQPAEKIKQWERKAEGPGPIGMQLLSAQK